MHPIVSRRCLNRTLLHRQGLLERAPGSPSDAVHHLIAVQSQIPTSPYVALWSRLVEFTPEDLGSLLVERRLVRLSMFRSTIHLLTRDDALAFRSGLQQAMDRGLKAAFGRALRDLDLDEVAQRGRTLVEALPMTLAQLGAVLADDWPSYAPLALANAVRTKVPLVQVPPRGLWGATSQARHTSLELWLNDRPTNASDFEVLVTRYLAAFGPATLADVQAWSGLTGLRAVVDRLGARLCRRVDEAGVQLFDLSDGELIDESRPAPVRFLAQFDPAVISHVDRRRILGDRDRQRVATPNGISPGMVLVDGFVEATWTMSSEGLVVRSFRPVTRATEDKIESEAVRLLGFLEPDAARRTISFEAHR